MDALCIIQGSDGYFNEEAAQMESVYTGTTLTIAAASAKNSNEGFLGPRNPLGQQPCQILTTDSFTVLAQPIKRVPSLETSPESALLIAGAGYFKSVFYPLEHCSLGKYGKDTEIFRKAWQQVMEVYSKTDLTYKADKLVAVAGIAGLVQRRLNMQASFGPWIDFFDTELMWTTNNGGFGRPISCILARVLKYPDATSFSNVGYDRQHGIASRFAAIVGGTRRRCRAVSYCECDPGDLPLDSLYPYVESNSYQNKGDAFYADFYISGKDQMALYCLHVAHLRSEDPVDGDGFIDLGIVLTPINLAESLFRRVRIYRELTRSQSGPKMFKDFHSGSNSTVHIL
ncbi:uncharacterized protein PAC_00290 [Phialocephala subalpina]|uniref:Heterokaryon incompatibility domain-containing protein n=1 Tax=Phialocephala subalpina TaxID=576137 RepID=A0A1L7WCC9_9HELO|nr:uncharacterized protein PAC_00290 [Phialocephala subalpina]